MDSEVEYSFLEYFPTDYFTRLVKKWENISIDLHPNGLLSKDNHEKIIELVQNMKISRIKQLKKLGMIFNISNVWWKVYQISKLKPLSLLKSRNKIFSVEQYVSKEITKIKGQFTIKELSENVFLIAIEFTSRSRFLRRSFRYLFLPSVKTILVEKRNLADEILQGEILPFITEDVKKIVQKPVRARTIKILTQKTSEDLEQPIFLTELRIKISLETSGIEGLNQIIIQGENVIRGTETLESRHEISMKFMNSGPWVGAGTKDFKFEVGKGLQIHRLEDSSLKSLATVLSWF
ncbi:MAG: hypothetical protein ACXAC8_09940 [Candidatus Hodarchaeales archaeon]